MTGTLRLPAAVSERDTSFLISSPTESVTCYGPFWERKAVWHCLVIRAPVTKPVTGNERNEHTVHKWSQKHMALFIKTNSCISLTHRKNTQKTPIYKNLTLMKRQEIDHKYQFSLHG